MEFFFPSTTRRAIRKTPSPSGGSQCKDENGTKDLTPATPIENAFAEPPKSDAGNRTRQNQGGHLPIKWISGELGYA